MFGLFTKNEKPELAESLDIYFHNTLSGKKEVFTPLKPGEVKMYNCGPTVYDRAQIGNFASGLLADLLKRVLKYNNYRVAQVVNMTDFGHLSGDNEGDSSVGEDRMTKGLVREGKELTMENMLALAKKYIDLYMEDMKELNFDTKGTKFPRASEYIKEQIMLVEMLEGKGYTYEIEDGIYFDTSRFPEYGKLGNINLEGLKEGIRVDTKGRKTPYDFVLWRKDTKLGWNSPWGMGFPGWHIECTAMIFALLGKQIDIHTGGIDHIPIHHNNEIAQAEAATGKKYVNYWLHKAFITIEGRRIGKSEGNAITLPHLIEKGYNPLTYRYWLLTGHYRSPMNFTWTALDGAQQALFRLHRLFVEDLGRRNGTINTAYQKQFHKAINDDLDTPKAIAVLWDLVKDESVSKEDKRATILDFDRVLGIGFAEGVKKLKDMLSVNVVEVEDLPTDVRTLVDKRQEARESKDWDIADSLRDEIREKGYIVEDTEDGPQIHRESA